MDAQEREREEKTKITTDKPHGNMSKTSHFRKLAEVKEEFERHCDGWQEKIDVSLHLLTKSDHIINTNRMQIKVIPKTKKETNKQLSQSDTRKIKRKADHVREVLLRSRDSEIILEDLLLATVFSTTFTTLVLEEHGVVVAEALKPRFKVICDKYEEIKQNLVSHRRGDDIFLANR